MWKLIEMKKLPPTRIARYCCSVLKETSTPNRLVALGVRRAESSKRANRMEFEVRAPQIQDALRYNYEHVLENYQISQENDPIWDCKIISNAKENNDVICNPIIYWTDEDIWTWISLKNIPINELYLKGYKRIGCVGCPFAGTKERERKFLDFPKYKLNYIRAFDRMMEKGKADGKVYAWENGEEVFNWWMGYQPKDEPQLEGQESFYFKKG